MTINPISKRLPSMFIAALVPALIVGCVPCNQPSDCPTRSEVCGSNGFCAAAGTVDIELVPGRFSPFQTCDVTAPPTDLGFGPNFTQYINCSGIAILAVGDVSPDALVVADETVAFLLRGNDDSRDQMISSGEFHVLRGPGVSANDLPFDFVGVDEGTTWSGSFLEHVSTTRGQYLLCDDSEPGFYESNQFVEAMSGHIFFTTGFHTGLADQANDALANARSNGLWDNTFAQQSLNAYISELSAKWFEVGRPAGPVNGDGVANGITTRDQMRLYDRLGHDLMDTLYTDSFDVPGCIQRNVVTYP